MNSKQFAWLYLVTNGYAGQTPSFYGGSQLADDRAKKIKCSSWDHSPIRESYMKEISTIGVNWEKTDAPSNQSYNMFTDTFHSPESREFIEGELVLNNGLRQTWYTEALEVTNVFDMMAKVEEYTAKYYTIFKE